MNIIELLRKLGILRFGVKKYRFSSGRDMSAEALLDDVYDEEKDLVSHKQPNQRTKETLHQNIGKKGCPVCGAAIQPGDSFCGQCGAKLD